MSKINILITVIIVILVAGGAIFLTTLNQPNSLKSFQACMEAGYPILESYPRQCVDSEGNTFTEIIDNNNNSDQPVILDNLSSGDTVASPLTITGQARGWWFFEASFPVVVIDDRGRNLATGIAQAQSDWMTEDFVPFKVTLNFTSSTESGKIILQRDNPSGLPENDAEVIVPVKFKTTTASTKACVPGGCSSQLCVEEDSDGVSTCEFKAEYACYKNATCSRNSAGKCAWVETNTLKACLQNPPALN